MVRDVIMNLTTFDPDDDDNGSGDVSGSGDGEETFSTTVTPFETTAQVEPHVTDENSDIFPTVIVATATSIAIVVVIAFLVIAFMFWKKAKSKARARKLSQHQNQLSPSAAISYNHTSDEVTPFGSPVTTTSTLAIPDVVPQPRPRTKLTYLKAQESPVQELLDHGDRLSSSSHVYDEIKGNRTSGKII